MNELEQQLQAPFEEKDIEWRIGRSGDKNGKIWATCLAYVTNRAIQNRLDELFGCWGWKNEFKEWHETSQLCGISILIDDGKEWITKWDGADVTNFEATKGGLSDSMKRAAVQWGIGRYLYNLDEGFAEISTEKKKGWKYQSVSKGKDGKIKTPVFYWRPPTLPSWAIVENKTKQPVVRTTTGDNLATAPTQLDRDFTAEFNECATANEVVIMFNLLSPKDKTKADGVKRQRIRELNGVA